MSGTRTKTWLQGLCVSGGVLDVAAALGPADPSTDVTAPVTTPAGVPAIASDTRVIVQLYAADGSGGAGVASTQWRLDGGSWKGGTRVVVAAPADAVATRMLEYRSTDRAGNAEDVKATAIVFDTTVNADDAPSRACVFPPRL